MTRDVAGVIGPENYARDLIAKKIGHKLLLSFIAVKINFRISFGIIIKDLGSYFIFGAASHHDLVYPHERMIILIATKV
jgi:hypothetical protein